VTRCLDPGNVDVFKRHHSIESSFGKILGSVYLIPVILEQQLFDRVSVVHFGGAKMPELYDYRIMVESPVEGGL